MSKCKVIEINEGKKIDFEQNNYKLTFGDDEISVRCDRYQKDWDVHLDVCVNKDGNLVIGTNEGCYYAAQIDIPAIQYEDAEDVQGETSSASSTKERTPIPLDMTDVTVTLWSIEAFGL
jgi:hypothetical protein